MCDNNISEKGSFFTKTPTNITEDITKKQVMKQHISQEARELLIAGYDIYHISAHRDTTILVVDPEKNEIFDRSGEFQISDAPKDLNDLIRMVEKSEMSDASVIQIQI